MTAIAKRLLHQIEYENLRDFTLVPSSVLVYAIRVSPKGRESLNCELRKLWRGKRNSKPSSKLFWLLLQF